MVDATRLAGKVALVTGAGSGIGRAIAQRFHAEGASVVAVDRSGAQDETAAALGDRATAVNADVGSEADVRGAIEAAVRIFGRLDILVSAAGIDGEPGPITAVTEDNLDRVFAVNVKGAFFAIKHAVPAMAANGGGSIILVSSASALRGMTNGAPYTTSKAAQLQLTRVAALENAAVGVRVNAIAPGATNTAMFRNVVADNPPVAEFAAAATPFKRIGEPEEVAATAAFLASDEASYVTGVTIAVDGGFSI